MHVVGPHVTNIKIIGSIMILASLAHILLNFYILNERMNELSWIGSLLGIIGSMMIWMGAGKL